MTKRKKVVKRADKSGFVVENSFKRRGLGGILDQSRVVLLSSVPSRKRSGRVMSKEAEMGKNLDISRQEE